MLLNHETGDFVFIRIHKQTYSRCAGSMTLWNSSSLAPFYVLGVRLAKPQYVNVCWYFQKLWNSFKENYVSVNTEQVRQHDWFWCTHWISNNFTRRCLKLAGYLVKKQTLVIVSNALEKTKFLFKMVKFHSSSSPLKLLILPSFKSVKLVSVLSGNSCCRFFLYNEIFLCPEAFNALTFISGKVSVKVWLDVWHSWTILMLDSLWLGHN